MIRSVLGPSLSSGGALFRMARRSVRVAGGRVGERVVDPSSPTRDLVVQSGLGSVAP